MAVEKKSGIMATALHRTALLSCCAAEAPQIEGGGLHRQRMPRLGHSIVAAASGASHTECLRPITQFQEAPR